MLHYTCMTGNMEIAEILLHAGASYKKDDEKVILPEQYIFEEGGETKVNDAWKELGEERKRNDEEEQNNSECQDGKPNDTPTTTTTSAKVTVQKGLDKAASYTASELIIYPEILCNKPTVQVPVPIETAMSSKIIGEKGPVRSVANAIRLQEHG